VALFMAEFTYTPEAWARLAKQPEDRSLGLKAITEQLGGRLLHLYYSFGEYDGVVIFEAPDDIAGAVTPLAANVAGHLKAIKTTKLISVEDAMTIMQKVGTVTYKAPTG
jgi:uncharacterized protein with GYD domain